MTDSIFKSVFDTPPEFVNSEGIKWWKDKSTTDYATRPDGFGTVLDIQAWIVECPNGYRTHILIEGENIIGDGQSLEAIGAKIDWLKCAKRFDDAEKKGQ